jgi:histidine triad (HIT) family protein
MDALLPVDRLTENDHWLAFHHPQPEYALHILIVPKTRLVSLDEAADQPVEFHQDFYRVVKTLISDFDLNSSGYRLISNGGPNQQVPQWHWHLVSGDVMETHD